MCNVHQNHLDKLTKNRYKLDTIQIAPIFYFCFVLNTKTNEKSNINNMLYIYNLSTYITKCKSKKKFNEYRYKNSKYRSIRK